MRLAVRRPEQVARTFAGRDVVPDEVEVVDLFNSASVVRALEGCDAVVHAAAVFSLDPRKGEEVLSTNERVARTVLEAAVEAGCDPVIHISSTVALLRRAGTTPPSRLAMSISRTPGRRSPPNAWPASCSSEEPQWCRCIREAFTARPTRTCGNRQPAWRGLPGGAFRSGRPVACTHVDVRDTAAVVEACLQPDRGPRRYVVPGHHMTGDDLYQIVGATIGRRRPHVSLPTRLVPVLTAPIDALHRLLPTRWRYPADREGAEIGARNTWFDTSAAEQELGVHARPLEGVRARHGDVAGGSRPPTGQVSAGLTVSRAQTEPQHRTGPGMRPL